MSSNLAGATPAAPLRAIVEELVGAGVRDVVICPGSRSTPMALALRADPALRTWMHLDERAGAFFALGVAKASRRTVAILATSGTAVVNFAPAVVEARQGRVPLLLLTADRPPELRDRGAAQTIDQDHLYGRFTKWFAELPVPDTSGMLDAHIRGVVGRAVATAAAAPAGPVQINLPFREPLLPEGSLLPPMSAAPGPDANVIVGARRVDRAEIESLAARLAAADRGLIVCGPLDAPGFPDAVAKLAGASGFPVISDALSNVRVGPHDRSHVIAHHNALLRTPRFRDQGAPDLVLRFGATPTSKVLIETLREQAAAQIVVDDGGWAETTLLPVTMVQAEPVGLATDLAAMLGEAPARQENDWLASWLEADAAAADAIGRWQASLAEAFEGAVFAALQSVLPDGAVLFAGNGMPVWDMDGFLGSEATQLRCLGNRGANGIDGLVSTTLGVAAAHDGPVVGVIGDISFIHDLNALVSAGRHELSATIVLVDNDGGGIFSFLPQASAERPDVGLPEHYEELFGTPHGLDFGALVTAMGGEHQTVGPGELASAVAASLGRPGIKVLELRSDRGRNVELHREATRLASVAVEAWLERRAGRGASRT